MTLEIQIHQEIRHGHIVGFHTYFEDKDNVYILLELCRNRVRKTIALLRLTLLQYFGDRLIDWFDWTYSKSCAVVIVVVDGAAEEEESHHRNGSAIFSEADRGVMYLPSQSQHHPSRPETQ